LNRLLRRMFEPEGSEVTDGFRTLIIRSFTCCVVSSTVLASVSRRTGGESKLWPKEQNEHKKVVE
jgi:hypothetical protein